MRVDFGKLKICFIIQRNVLIDYISYLTDGIFALLVNMGKKAKVKSFHINHVVLPDHRQHQQKNLTSKKSVLWSFWCCKPEHREDSLNFHGSNDTWTQKGSWCCWFKKIIIQQPSPYQIKLPFPFDNLFPSNRKNKLLSSFTVKQSCIVPSCLLAKSFVPEQVPQWAGHSTDQSGRWWCPRECSI